MATDRPQITAYLTDEIKAALENYRNLHRLRSLSSAVEHALKQFLSVGQEQFVTRAELETLSTELAELRGKVDCLMQSQAEPYQAKALRTAPIAGVYRVDPIKSAAVPDEEATDDRLLEQIEADTIKAIALPEPAEPKRRSRQTATKSHSLKLAEAIALAQQRGYNRGKTSLPRDYRENPDLIREKYGLERVGDRGYRDLWAEGAQNALMFADLGEN